MREAVSANNDALEHAIQYGWEYLSKQMKAPGYFDRDFYDYITRKYVGDVPYCGAGSVPDACVSEAEAGAWELCPPGKYCLGYSEAFQPLNPNLTSLLLAMMASKTPVQTVLKTIGCMEGKYEVYGDCFPDRSRIADALSPPPGQDYASTTRKDALCLQETRRILLERRPADEPLSCEALDLVALEAQKRCRVAQSFPMSCFTLQAAKTFFPQNAFSTFALRKLNGLAETPLAETFAESDSVRDKDQATPIGLLRSSVADFLYHYKMSAQFPERFGSYELTHSAQQLNALFNPLVVAFNQDVVAHTQFLMEATQKGSDNKNHWYEMWRRGQSFLNNGMVTVRGISGIESIAETATQNFFDATQPVNLKQFLASATAGAGTPGGLLDSALTRDWAAKLLTAITPTPATAKLGRQLKLDITPTTLAGASSAELDVKLTSTDSRRTNDLQFQ